jgi:hypothetical protein
MEAPFPPGAGPVCPNELLGEPNECPGEKLEAPPPPRAPGPFASAVEEMTASVMAMAASEKILFMGLSLGFDLPRGFDQEGRTTEEMVCPLWDICGFRMGRKGAKADSTRQPVNVFVRPYVKRPPTEAASFILLVFSVLP